MAKRRGEKNVPAGLKSRPGSKRKIVIVWGTQRQKKSRLNQPQRQALSGYSGWETGEYANRKAKGKGHFWLKESGGQRSEPARVASRKGIAKVESRIIYLNGRVKKTAIRGARENGGMSRRKLGYSVKNLFPGYESGEEEGAKAF